MFYSTRADEVRDFIKDKLALPHTDVGEGWLIFDVAEGDVGVHPTDEASADGKHDISFYCDDIEATVAELEGRGVRFTGPVEDHGYGLVTYFLMPGDMRVQLYQARYRKNAPRVSAPRKTASRTAAPKNKRPAVRAKKPANKAPKKAARKKVRR